jgi:hypothetical protein
MQSVFEFIGISLEVIGTLMIAYIAIRVHYRFWKEHKIDSDVFAEMHHELKIGITGMTIIALGYLIQVYPLIKNLFL